MRALFLVFALNITYPGVIAHRKAVPVARILADHEVELVGFGDHHQTGPRVERFAARVGIGPQIAVRVVYETGVHESIPASGTR